MATRRSSAADGKAAPADAPNLLQDDDFVPPEIFGSREREDGGTPWVGQGMGPEHADFIPPDIFGPGDGPERRKDTPRKPVQDGMPKTVAPTTPSAAPAVPAAETQQDEDEAPPAPTLPPLSSPPSARPLSKPLPDPEPAVVSAAPGLTASLAATPMMRSSNRYEPPGADTSHAASSVDHLLQLAASLGATTLYLSSNTRPSVRIDGEVRPLDGTPVLGPNEIETLLVSLVLTHHGATRGALTLSEWSFDLQDVGRVRCMTFRDGRGPGALFRIVRGEGAAVDQVELSLDIQALAVEREGLVVVAGPRASGKQAAIGSLVDLVTRTRRGYVIAVQREVTVLSEAEGSFVSQREARGGLTDILAVARAALQENPDVLVLEEVRSAPLMDLALDAAASGQLVIAGFTAPNASGAVERILDLYPPEQARHVQLALAQHLRAVVGQVLLPKIGGGRIVARELLLNSPAVASVLAAGKIAHLATAIAAGRNQGMVPLSDVLVDLVRTGVVSATDAYGQAADQTGFLDDLQRLGIDTSFAHSPA